MASKNFVTEVKGESSSESSTNVDDTTGAKVQNAVDYLMEMFPVEKDEKTDETQVWAKNNESEIEDEVNFYYESESSEVSEHNSVDETSDRSGASNSTESDDLSLKFDPDLGSSYGYTELNGNRWYWLDGTMICLKSEDLDELKNMGKTQKSDSNFVSVLLSVIFGNDVLKKSSGGGRSNYNQISHSALDSKKLKFIKGIFIFKFKNNEFYFKTFFAFLQTYLKNALKVMPHERTDLLRSLTRNAITYDGNQVSNTRMIYCSLFYV